MENNIINLIDIYGIFRVFTFGEAMLILITIVASLAVGIYVIVDLIKDEIYFRGD